VHELRYVLAYGDGSGRAAAAQGHAYLASVTAVVAVLVVLGMTTFIARLARGLQSDDGRPSQAPWRLWIATTTSMLLIFALQESVEGALGSGHPTGLEGVLGHGGWLAIPLAAAIGAMIALALRGAAASAAPAPSLTPSLRWSPKPFALRLLPSRSAARPDPLARHLAGRGPPPTFV
jgi:hypothetical protein